MVQCEKLRKLQILIFQENPIGDKPVITLAKAQAFANLRKLNLYRTDLSVKGIKILAKSKVLQRVKHLNLARNYLNLDSAQYLAKTKTLVNIETLLMFDTQIGDTGVKVIMDSEAFQKLKTLRVT